jgi:hypothetical protein
MDERNALFEISHESDQFFQDSSMAKVMNTLGDPLHGHYHRVHALDWRWPLSRVEAIGTCTITYCLSCGKTSPQEPSHLQSVDQVLSTQDNRTHVLLSLCRLLYRAPSSTVLILPMG